jgi:formiminotetrahydrofolate cyclodeaminase
MITFKEWGERQAERKFRASIYVDIWVPQTDDKEKDREEALKQAEEFAAKIPNSYVGGAATFQGLRLDKEI